MKSPVSKKILWVLIPETFQFNMVLNPINRFMEWCTKMAKSPISTLLGRKVLQAGTTQGGSVNKVINPSSEKRYKWAAECGSSGNQHSTHTVSISRHFAIQHSSVFWKRVVICAGSPLWRWKGWVWVRLGCLTSDWDSAERAVVSASRTWMISLVKVGFTGL